jgi:hypothetical protein
MLVYRLAVVTVDRAVAVVVTDTVQQLFGTVVLGQQVRDIRVVTDIMSVQAVALHILCVLVEGAVLVHREVVIMAQPQAMLGQVKVAMVYKMLSLEL